MQNASEIKEKILKIIEQSGPSLPVKIASNLGLSPLFASAFLSELLSQKNLKISYLRVGNSPVYFIPGQEPKLESFSEHLKSKEKEAFLFLKENKFLKDEEQQPAIRVALRAIKDFAIPFENKGVFFWRYFVIPESEFNKEEDSVEEIRQENESPTNQSDDFSTKEEIEEKPGTEENVEFIERKESEFEEKDEVIKNEEEIDDEEKVEEEPEIKEDIVEKKKIIKRKPAKKKNDKFFNQVKEFLAKKSIDILDIEGVSQKDLMLRINDDGEEKLLVAYNKKRVGEDEIIRANKKAEEIGLNYIILSLGGPLKKLQNLIKAIKNLSEIEKLE
jgi:hypothetical protein